MDVNIVSANAWKEHAEVPFPAKVLPNSVTKCGFANYCHHWKLWELNNH